jgi:type II secretory pathway pseudopilin PulG
VPRTEKPAMNCRAAPNQRQAKRRALTLLEVVVSTLIVGVMIVAALETLGAAMRSGNTAGNLSIALGLADERLADILNTSYAGIDAYNNQSEQFAGDRDGWSRHTIIERVTPSNPTQLTAGNVDQQVKRIRVTVELGGQEVVEQIAVVSNTE